MDVSNESANVTAKGKIIWGACQREGSPENFFEIGLSETPFSAFAGLDPDFITGMIICFQLYGLHR